MEFKQDNLLVKTYETRDEMGKAAAADISACIGKLFTKKVRSEYNFCGGTVAK